MVTSTKPIEKPVEKPQTGDKKPAQPQPSESKSQVEYDKTALLAKLDAAIAKESDADKKTALNSMRLSVGVNTRL